MNNANNNMTNNMSNSNPGNVASNNISNPPNVPINKGIYAVINNQVNEVNNIPNNQINGTNSLSNNQISSVNNMVNQANNNVVVSNNSVSEVNDADNNLINDEVLNELEALRLKACRRFYLSLILSLIFLIVLVVLGQITLLFLTFFFYLILHFALCLKPAKDYSKRYKKTIILSAFKKKFTDIFYEPSLGIKREVIANTCMMNMGDTFKSNDYIKAKYNNITFESSDVLIQMHYRSNNETRVETLFRGQWFIFEFNKSFKSDFQVCENTFYNAKRKGIFASKDERFHKVELEDIDFNNKFNVYCQLEEDVFYVLTPSVIEYIKQLNDKISGALLFCFIDNKLHVALYNNKDLFETSIHKKINLEQDQQKTLEEMSYITDFIDILRLDNSLFKGGEK